MSAAAAVMAEEMGMATAAAAESIQGDGAARVGGSAGKVVAVGKSAAVAAAAEGAVALACKKSIDGTCIADSDASSL